MAFGTVEEESNTSGKVLEMKEAGESVMSSCNENSVICVFNISKWWDEEYVQGV